MHIVENFLSTDEYKQFTSLVANCTEKEVGEAHYNDDNAIQGFDNSAYLITTPEFQQWWLDILKSKNYIKDTVLPRDIVSLYILETKPPYHANWHRDSLPEEELDLGSIILYFGENLNVHDGGLFLTKENENDIHGQWVLPTDNVCTINPKDVMHLVTKYENKDIVRKIVIMFLRQRDFT